VGALISVALQEDTQVSDDTRSNDDIADHVETVLSVLSEVHLPVFTLGSETVDERLGQVDLALTIVLLVSETSFLILGFFKCVDEFLHLILDSLKLTLSFVPSFLGNSCRLLSCC